MIDSSKVYMRITWFEKWKGWWKSEDSTVMCETFARQGSFVIIFLVRHRYVLHLWIYIVYWAEYVCLLTQDRHAYVFVCEHNFSVLNYVWESGLYWIWNMDRDCNGSLWYIQEFVLPPQGIVNSLKDFSREIEC